MSNRNERDLLVIDQAPLLDAALNACQQACRKFEEFRAELERHVTQDLPAFERWNRSFFAAQVGEIETLNALVRERESALEKLRKHHWAKFFGSGCAIHAEVGMGFDDEEVVGGYSGLHASLRGARGESEDSDSGDGDGDGFEDSPDSDENLFGSAEGGNEEEVEDQDFDFDDLDSNGGYTEFFVRGGERRQGGYRARARESDDRIGAAGTAPRSHEKQQQQQQHRQQRGSQSAGASEPSRLKERYRILVRRLHPDLNPEVTPEQKRLWNQVQSAYREKDLEQLDLLLALSGALKGEVSSETSLYQLRRAAEEIRRSIVAVARKLDEARVHRAWKFSGLTDRSRLEREIERELKCEIRVLKRAFQEIESQTSRL